MEKVLQKREYAGVLADLAHAVMGFCRRTPSQAGLKISGPIKQEQEIAA